LFVFQFSLTDREIILIAVLNDLATLWVSIAVLNTLTTSDVERICHF
jgi:hypothetical protein